MACNASITRYTSPTNKYRRLQRVLAQNIISRLLGCEKNKLNEVEQAEEALSQCNDVFYEKEDDINYIEEYADKVKL